MAAFSACCEHSRWGCPSCLVLAAGQPGHRDSLQGGERKLPLPSNFSFCKVFVQKQGYRCLPKKELIFWKYFCAEEGRARKAGKVSANHAQQLVGCSTEMLRWRLLCKLSALICSGRDMCNTKGIWASNNPKFTEGSSTLWRSSAETWKTGSMDYWCA